MASSTAATALVILTILIASEVSSAPREERLEQDSKREKFMETREAEVLERYSIGNEKYGLSREDEVRHRPARLVKEPAAPKNESETVSTKKPTAVDNKNETLEAKDMNESVASPDGDDDTTDSNKTLPKSTDNNKNKPVVVEVSENTNSTENATIVNVQLPPKYFPEDGLRKTNEAKIRYLEHQKEDGATPDTATNKTSDTNSAVGDVEKTSATISSTIPTTVSSTVAAITTEAPTTTTTTTTSATQPSSVPTTIITSTTNTVAPPTPIGTTEYSPKSEVITANTMMVFSTEPSKAELQLHARKIAPMPSGVVALITAIAFAIVAVMAYVGLVAWRRYLEWRYGNRELLVNDFDANDIGNFEL